MGKKHNLHPAMQRVFVENVEYEIFKSKNAQKDF